MCLSMEDREQRELAESAEASSGRRDLMSECLSYGDSYLCKATESSKLKELQTAEHTVAFGAFVPSDCASRRGRPQGLSYFGSVVLVFCAAFGVEPRMVLSVSFCLRAKG